jgi:hypothetical protein
MVAVSPPSSHRRQDHNRIANVAEGSNERNIASPLAHTVFCDQASAKVQTWLYILVKHPAPTTSSLRAVCTDEVQRHLVCTPLDSAMQLGIRVTFRHAGGYKQCVTGDDCWMPWHGPCIPILQQLKRLCDALQRFGDWLLFGMEWSKLHAKTVTQRRNDLQLHWYR